MPDLPNTVQADRALLMRGDPPGILHLEAYSSVPKGAVIDLLRYNRNLARKFGPPVHTIVLVLRPDGYHRALTEQYVERSAGGKLLIHFGYWVVRVWERSFAELLDGGPALMPLAMLSNEVRRKRSGRERYAAQFLERARTEEPDPVAQRLLLETATTMCGLRYTHEEVRQMFGSLNRLMKESSVFQEELRLEVKRQVDEAVEEATRRAVEERARTLRQSVLTVLNSRFARVSAGVAAFVESVADPEHLLRLVAAAARVASPDELTGVA